jgi:hypothetical protein
MMLNNTTTYALRTKVGGQEEGLKQRGARNRFTMATNLRYAPRTG